MKKTESHLATLIRVAFVALLILLQVALVVLLVRYLRTYSLWIYLAIEVLSVLTLMVMVSRNNNSSYTIAWILIITLLPVFGLILYFLWGRSDVMGPRPKRIRSSIERGNTFLTKDPAVYRQLGSRWPGRKRMAGYLGRNNFPLYQGTRCQYYALGEHQFDAMIPELAAAKKFIFLSTFILCTGKLWDRVQQVLIQKADEGVEIRLMYDDLGSLFMVPKHLVRELKEHGVKVVAYSPIHRFVSRLYLNYRNHQKFSIIDGTIGYTGGTNFADEYANYYEKHGHWKDTAIRLEGDAVWSMTVNFLQMWDAETHEATEYGHYRPTHSCEGEGFFQPFADGPVNNPQNPAETSYRMMINNAQQYVYITTPYLIINNNMMESLCTAALSGVDVRIITPKKPDHWYVHAVTRSNYKPLLQAGVRVFEYTPGFIHCKTILSDDNHAITGSINMDYRSFYLHFENAVWMCGDAVLQDIRRDFDDTFAVCEEIQLEAWLKRPRIARFVGGFLRIFAVLL